MLLGPVPGGDYRLALRGYQSTGDARIHAALAYRPQVGAEQTMAQADGATQAGDGGPPPGDINLTLHAPAVPAACGDDLVLRLQFVSGSSPYLELIVNLTTP